jgi:hypothetical protein
VWAVLLVAAWLCILAGTAGGLPPSPPGPTKTRIALSKLRIAPSIAVKGFTRKKFGSGWATIDGCKVRALVLIRDGTRIRRGPNCTVLAGHWPNHYDTRDLNSPNDVQIDHVVPLGEAWRSGARKWSYERRRAFANDLDSPELLAASGKSNSAKQDSPPNEWRPSRRRSWCIYARWWVEVKRAWKLTVTREEKTALRAMLSTAPC